MALKGRELLLSEGIFTLKKCPGPGMCPVVGCRAKSRTGRNSCHGLCAKHKTQRWRTLNPAQSGFQILRHHAKQRKLEFNLSPDYYYGLMDCAAAWDRDAEKRGDTVTIDRKDETKGYLRGNCVVVTLSENVAKNNRCRHLPVVVQAILARKRAKAQEEAWKLHGEPDLEKDPF